MMLRFTPSLRLQPRRSQTITSYQVCAMVRFSGRIAPNRRIRTNKQIQPFDRQKFRSDGDCRQRVVARIISKLPDLSLQSYSISEMPSPSPKLFLMLYRQCYNLHHVARINSGGARQLKPQRPSQHHWMRGRMHDDPCALVLGTQPRGRC